MNYDEQVISLSDILRVFFENHDYSSRLPQRYASSIFFTELAQYDEAIYFMKTRLVRFLNSLLSRTTVSSRVWRL